VNPQPVLPQYSGANVRGIVPALLAPTGVPLPHWMPRILDAPQRVVLIIDGLGWEQMQSHRELLPTMMSMEASPITTVAPSTTATALTSIVTGLTPAEHGLIGYRIDVGGDILNVLRWNGERTDLRRSHPPPELQPFSPFLGEAPPVISRAELEGSGFTEAHLRGSRLMGWRMPSAIAVEISHQLAKGERFIYAYYDGIDKTAHERGFGDYYDAELATVDRLVADVLAAMPNAPSIDASSSRSESVRAAESFVCTWTAMSPLPLPRRAARGWRQVWNRDSTAPHRARRRGRERPGVGAHDRVRAPSTCASRCEGRGRPVTR